MMSMRGLWMVGVGLLISFTIGIGGYVSGATIDVNGGLYFAP